MQHGLTIFLTDYSIDPATLAEEAEARGFESLWLPEHTHIPAERRSPWPGGAELPKMYYDVFEPFVALATAAARTRKLKVATGICLVVQRDPLQLAKNIATLDQVSNGRFLFGIGAGWNAEEMENHGTTWKTRITLMRERVEAMKTIWSEKEAEYHGRFVDFDPVMSWPKPLQKPHPPVHVGGGWPHGAERAIAYGDGWMPIHGRDPVAPQIPEFRKRAEDAGRDASKLEVTVFGMVPDRAELEGYREAGADRVVFGLPPAPRDDVLPLLDRYAALAEADA